MNNYRLKSYLEEKHQNQTAEEIYSELSSPVIINSDLNSDELSIFFATNPNVESRLEKYIELNETVDVTQGCVKLALRMANKSAINVPHNEAKKALTVLLKANLITAEEIEHLNQYLYTESTVGKQELGYLPNVDQIQEALNLSWPIKG